MMCSAFVRKSTLRVLLSTVVMFAMKDTSAQKTGEIVSLYRTDTVEIGDDFEVKLLLTSPGLQPTVTVLKAWEKIVAEENVIGMTSWLRSEQGWSQEIHLIFFDSGTVELPPLPVVLLSGDTLWTTASRIHVHPPPIPEEGEPWRDIKDVWQTPISWMDYKEVLVAIAIGILIFSLVLYWLWHRPKEPRKPRERALLKPPHQVAYEQLKALERQQLWERGEFRTYYTELSRIVREYVERQYGLPALESSTEELLEMLNGIVKPPLLPPLRELLGWCDLVKFARATLPEHCHLQAIREARRFVEQATLSIAAEAESSQNHISEPPN